MCIHTTLIKIHNSLFTIVLHNFTVRFYRVVITILHYCHRLLLACLATAGDHDCLPGLTL